LQIIIRDHPSEVAELAAALVRAQILRKPECVLGLATGSTPVPLYGALARMSEDGLLDMSLVTSYNLDEYVGLAADHPQSYHTFMREHLFDRAGVRPDQAHLPDGAAGNPDAECIRYEAEIKAAGGIDLQILGIGLNGHIGFNEPSESFSKQTCAVELTQSTLQANRRFFGSDEEVPRRALTMGIGTIFGAREILLIAVGAGKADIIRRTVRGDITPQVPASVLQLHPNTRLLLDREAASAL